MHRIVEEFIFSVADARAIAGDVRRVRVGTTLLGGQWLCEQLMPPAARLEFLIQVMKAMALGVRFLDVLCADEPDLPIITICLHATKQRFISIYVEKDDEFALHQLFDLDIELAEPEPVRS